MSTGSIEGADGAASPDLGFRLDSESTVRQWEQLRRHIASAGLPEGYRLPAIRSIAEAVKMAPNTVARAIRELEADGVVVTRGRHGTYVVGHSSMDMGLDALAGEYVAAARRLGAGNADIIDAVRRTL